MKADSANEDCSLDVLPGEGFENVFTTGKRSGLTEAHATFLQMHQYIRVQMEVNKRTRSLPTAFSSRCRQAVSFIGYRISAQ